MTSNIYTLKASSEDLSNIPAEAEKVARYNGLNEKQVLRLRLLSEELICMMPQLLRFGDGEFWIENNGNDYALRLVVTNDKNYDYDIDKIISVSSDGKNAAAKGIINKICLAVECMMNERVKLARTDPYAFYSMGLTDHSNNMGWSLMNYRQSLDDAPDSEEKAEDWDELEKSIIANLADDVIVGVKGGKIDITIRKSFG